MDRLAVVAQPGDAETTYDQPDEECARYVANFLVEHPKVERIYYLGLLTETDPQYAVYRRQCVAPGAMISFDIVGGEAQAFRFLNVLELIWRSASATPSRWPNTRQR